MSEVYVFLVMLAVTFLLICWVAVRYPSGRNVRRMEEAIQKPGILSRIGARQVMFGNTMRSVGNYRQELLIEKNKLTFLFNPMRRNVQGDECKTPAK